jgi:hypothetical protein
VVDYYQQSGGTVSLNQTSLSVSQTAVLSGGIFNLFSSSPTASAGLQIQSGGTLDSTYPSTITGDVTNAGTLDLTIGHTLSILTITGNYTQSGTLTVGLGGTQPSSYTSLHVSGNVAFGGVLNVVLFGSFMPAPTNTFSVVTFGSYSGAFATVNLPPLLMGSWDPRYNDPQGTFTLWVLPP